MVGVIVLFAFIMSLVIEFLEKITGFGDGDAVNEKKGKITIKESQ